jgi:hypothetical protein
MTSHELRDVLKGFDTGPEWAQAYMLKEIALQLAVANEQAQQRHEESLLQRDAFLLADPEPRKTVGDIGSKRTVAALRSCARTILEEQLNPVKASDYLNKYADAVLSHEAWHSDPEANPRRHFSASDFDRAIRARERAQARELMAKTDKEQS